MKCGLLFGLVGIGGCALELIQRGQEGLECRLSNENVLVKVVVLMRRTPLDPRVAVILCEHRLPPHSPVNKAVFLAIVARLLGRGGFEFFSVQILLYILLNIGVKN